MASTANAAGSLARSDAAAWKPSTSMDSPPAAASSRQCSNSRVGGGSRNAWAVRGVSGGPVNAWLGGNAPTWTSRNGPRSVSRTKPMLCATVRTAPGSRGTSRSTTNPSRSTAVRQACRCAASARNSGQDPCGKASAISSADHSLFASSVRSSSPVNESIEGSPAAGCRPSPPASSSPIANWLSQPTSKAPRWPSGPNTISTRSPARRAVLTETSRGRSVMLTSRSPFRESQQCAHLQLTRSQIAGSPNGARPGPAEDGSALTGYPGRSGGFSASPVTSLRHPPGQTPRALRPAREPVLPIFVVGRLSLLFLKPAPLEVARLPAIDVRNTVPSARSE